MSQYRLDMGELYPARVRADAFDEGMELEPVLFGPITRADIVRYAGASGDFNPIHIDEDYARATGAPTVFAMGMLPAGYLATAVGRWFGGPQHLKRFKVRFTTRVWPRDEILCTGSITEIDGTLIKMSLEARRRGAGPEGLDLQSDEVVIKGEAEVQLPE